MNAYSGTSITLYPSLYLEQQYLNIETSTTVDQRTTEQECLRLLLKDAAEDLFDNKLQEDADPGEESDNTLSTTVDTENLVLEREKQLRFLIRGLETHLPRSLIQIDASRIWCLYWLIHAIDLLNEAANEEDGNGEGGSEMARAQALKVEKGDIRHFTQQLWDPVHGGYAGGPMQMAHLASNFAAVMCLIISGSESDYASIDRGRMYQFLLNMRDSKTGGFRMHHDGEVDMRSTFCAIAVASILHIVTEELTENLVEYVVRCQTYEGGIAAEIGDEAHGGYTYCGLAALSIIGEATKLNLNAVLRWAIKRQMGLEGGFQGRTNKLVDSCYSFWVGGIFTILREVFRQHNLPVPSGHCWFAAPNLQMYLLGCCQSFKGGMRDKPKKSPDYYHTCYSISGLSIAQHAVAQCVPSSDAHFVVGPPTNLVGQTDFFYNVNVEMVQKARQYFSEHPFIAPNSNLVGKEGLGVARYYSRMYSGSRVSAIS